jgi:hypothetical protein
VGSKEIAVTLGRFIHGRGDGSKVPDEAEPRHGAKYPIGRVILPPIETLANGPGMEVVVVVPAFAEGEDGEEPVVSAVVRGGESARADTMGE